MQIGSPYYNVASQFTKAIVVFEYLKILTIIKRILYIVVYNSL
jgi:hypothetical protein